METIYWHLENGFLKETARMDRPDGSTYRLIDEYRDDEREYQKHIASLRSTPILPNSEWKKKEKLVEGEDFHIRKGTEVYCNSSMKGFVAVPILPTPETFTVTREMLEELWQQAMDKAHALYNWSNRNEYKTLPDMDECVNKIITKKQ